MSKYLFVTLFLLLSFSELYSQTQDYGSPTWYFKDPLIRRYDIMAINKNGKVIHNGNERITVVFSRTQLGRTQVKIKGNWPNYKTQFYIERIEYHSVKLVDGTYSRYYTAEISGEETHTISWSIESFSYHIFENDDTYIILRNTPFKE